MNTLIFFFKIRSSTTITRSLHSFYFKFIPIPVFNIILNSLLVCVVLVAVKMSYIFRQLVTHILIWKKLWGYKICQNPPNESSELIREIFFPSFYDTKILSTVCPQHYICWSELPVPRIAVTFSLQEVEEIERDCAVYRGRMERIAKHSAISREEQVMTHMDILVHLRCLRCVFLLLFFWVWDFLIAQNHQLHLWELFSYIA